MKYMLIDTTSLAETRILAVAKIRQVVLLGKLQQANGRTVMAPPVEGRGFSKLEPGQLQYLYWNTFAETPCEDYAELIAKCLEKTNLILLDATPLPDLEREVAKLEQAEASTEKADAPTVAKPRSSGATGRVWEIADATMTAQGEPFDSKLLRKAIIEACTSAGINPATASTQYAKWKASKSSSKGS